MHNNEDRDIPNRPLLDCRVDTNFTQFDHDDTRLVEFFTEHGWVTIRNTLSRDGIQTTLEQYKTMMSSFAMGVQLSLDEYGREITQHRDLFLQGGQFHDLIFSPERGFHRLAMKCMQWKGARLFHDHIIAKPAGDSSKNILPWHQDSMFWPVDLPGCSTWTPLEDVPEDGGCLEVLDRSHTKGCAQPVDFMGTENTIGSLLRQYPEAKHLRIPVLAGTTVLLHSLTWHRSSPNQSLASDRPVHISLWVPCDTRWRPDLVPWHPVNEHLEKISKPLARLEGVRHPMFGTLEDVPKPTADIHGGTVRYGSISMFDASKVISQQMESISGMGGLKMKMSDLLRDGSIRELIAEKTMRAGICVDTQASRAKLEQIVWRLYVSSKAYQSTRARNVYNDAYKAWWDLAGEQWQSRLDHKSFESVCLSRVEVKAFMARIGVRLPAYKHLDAWKQAETNADLDLLKRIVKGTMTRIPFQNFSMLTEERKRPSPQKIIDDMLPGGLGGLCTVRNPFLYLILKALHYKVSFISGTTFQLRIGGASEARVPVPDSHIALLVHVGDDHYWVDVGNGYPYLEPFRLGDAGVVEHPFMKYRVVEISEGGSRRLHVQHQKASDNSWSSNYTFSQTPVAYFAVALYWKRGMIG